MMQAFVFVLESLASNENLVHRGSRNNAGQWKFIGGSGTQTSCPVKSGQHIIIGRPLQSSSERMEAAGQEQAAQIEEASATINQWQEAYEQLNQQLKSAQVMKISILQSHWPDESLMMGCPGDVGKGWEKGGGGGGGRR